MKKPWPLKGSLTGSSGFTLTEVVVVVFLLVLVVGSVGTSIFYSLSTERSWRNDVEATRELRHTASWFAGDAMNAKTTGLIDGAPPATSVTLTWNDSRGTPHTAMYNLSGSALVRNFDGSEITLARRVTSAGFSLSGKVLTLDLEVEAELGTRDSTTLQTYLRMLSQ